MLFLIFLIDFFFELICKPFAHLSIPLNFISRYFLLMSNPPPQAACKWFKGSIINRPLDQRVSYIKPKFFWPIMKRMIEKSLVHGRRDRINERFLPYVDVEPDVVSLTDVGDLVDGIKGSVDGGACCTIDKVRQVPLALVPDNELLQLPRNHAASAINFQSSKDQGNISSKPAQPKYPCVILAP